MSQMGKVICRLDANRRRHDERGAMMVDDQISRKRWRRLTVVFCTLLLAASALLVLGVTGWAQGQTTGTTAQPTQQNQAVTIDFWEPSVGTTTIYYINDYLNDTHGDNYDTVTMGYLDILLDPVTEYPNYDWPYQLLDSHYYTVEATSNMNPVYFDLAGPWYFWMTTPFKVREEVIGIHEAPDASKFPQATYAVRKLVIGSGGHRRIVIEYWNNDAGLKQWLMWGYTKEYVPEGCEHIKKDTYVFKNTADNETPMPEVTQFPMAVGSSGSIGASAVTLGYKSVTTSDYYIYTPKSNEVNFGTYSVVAEGKVTVPNGTYDALLIQYTYTLPASGNNAKRIEYRWFVQNLGTVVYAKSLPNMIGPTYAESTGYYSTRADKTWYNSNGLTVMESTTAK